MIIIRSGKQMIRLLLCDILIIWDMPSVNLKAVNQWLLIWTPHQQSKFNVTNVSEIHHRVLTSFSFKNPSLFSSKSVSNLSFSPSRNSWRKMSDNFTKCLASKYNYYIYMSYYIYFCVYLILIFRTFSNKFLEVQLPVLVFVSILHHWLNDWCTHDVWMIFRMGKRNILFSIQFPVTIDISSLILKTSYYWLLIILF